MKLFVRNITFEATPADLQVFLSSRGYGPTEVKIVLSPEDGRSRGFGFVTFADAGSYEAALRELSGCEFMGRLLSVAPAHDKVPGQRRKSTRRPEGQVKHKFGWEDV